MKRAQTTVAVIFLVVFVLCVAWVNHAMHDEFDPAKLQLTVQTIKRGKTESVPSNLKLDTNCCYNLK